MIFTKLSSMRNQFIKVIQAIGSFLNQNLTEDQRKKIFHTPYFRDSFWKNTKTGWKNRETMANLKKSSKKKGNIRTETTIFNHPRKESPRGQQQ